MGKPRFQASKNPGAISTTSNPSFSLQMSQHHFVPLTLDGLLPQGHVTTDSS